MTFKLNETLIVEAFKNDESIIRKSKEICDDITNNKYSIVDFVENLGFALTSPIKDLRVNGTKLLSSTLMNLPPDYLNEQQLSFIVAFYCDRLKDHHDVMPAILDGFLVLSKMTNLPKGSSEKLFRGFLDNSTCQSQVKEYRYKFYLILESITERHCEELKEMRADFIYGVISSISGERDPRNLIFIFSFFPNFINKFPMYHLTEDVFETFACYFPVDFQPSNNDPKAITREALADKLANCLVASDEFAKWVVSLLIEKLGSDLIAAKLDSLELLRRAANKFPPEKLEPEFDNIWIVLKSEIFPESGDKDICSAGYEALKAILVNASVNQEISTNLQAIVFSTILMHLTDTKHLSFNSATTIALICVSADPLLAARKVLHAVFVKLHSEDENNDVEENIKILHLMEQVLHLCNERNVLPEIDEDLCQIIETECLKFLNHPTNDSSMVKSVIKLVTEAIQILSPESRKLFYTFLIGLLTNEKNDLDIQQALQAIHRHYSVELKKELIDKILQEFSKFPLHVKEKIYSNFSIFIVLTGLDIVTLDLVTGNIFDSKSIEEQRIALNALKALLITYQNPNQITYKLYNDYNLLDRIVNLVRANSDLPYDILGLIATILSLFIKQLNTDEQKIILDKYLPEMNLSRATDLFLTKGILGYMHESVNMDEHFESLLTELTKMSLENDDKVLREVSHHLLCSLLNKTEHNEKNHGILRNCIENLKKEIENHNKKAVEILSWFSKGLLVRGHPDAAELIEVIAELLDHPKLSDVASIGFDVISAEFPELHLPIVKLLFKQKFFHIVLNKIWNKLKTYSESHMNAFVYVLRMTPHHVLKLNLEKIGPVLFKCLELEKSSTVLISLEIHEKFLKEQDEYFRNHLNHLIPQLIKLTKNKNSMKIRISSLECLEALTKYPTFTLLPYKYDVIHGLVPALDDRKRLVRNTAVKARNVWFLIG